MDDTAGTGTATITFVGRDITGLLLATVEVDDAVISAAVVELHRRGDTKHGWLDLMVGPGGMVAAKGHEPFRVLRITARPSGTVYETSED